MKILHVCSNYYPANGGPQYTMKHLSEKMAAWYGDEVTVATSNSMYGPEQRNFKKIIPAIEVIGGVTVKRFKFNRWHFGLIDVAGKIYRKLLKKKLSYHLRKYRWEMDCPSLLQEMKNTTASVILATTVNYMFADYSSWRFSTKNPKPFILYGAIHLHINWDANSHIIRRAKQCDCYISNTEFERQRLISYGVDADKIVTIGTGIDISDMDCSKEQVKAFKLRYSIAEDDVLIGYVGRLSQGKGAGVLVDAYLNIAKKNKHVKLLLAGTSTEYVEILKQKIAGKSETVILLEDFDESYKPLLFNALDIFVLASEGESFGVVFLEAWACKKPVIGTKMGAIESLLSVNVDSLLFEPGNVASLSSCLELLIKDELLRNKMGKNGYDKVEEKYTWEKIIPAYKQAYESGIKNFERKINVQGFKS